MSAVVISRQLCLRDAINPSPARELSVIPPPADQGRRRHVAALDGLRGVAILLVILSHTSMDTHQATGGYVLTVYRRLILGGWCGVILFFVLSGYLITGILYDSRHHSRFFYNFYGRRTVRIFPLYYLFLLLMTFVLPVVQHRFSPSATLDSRPSVWHWFYLSNLEIVYRGMWVHGISTLAWSLAIEEQFYLVWPFLVWFLNRRQLLVACAVIAVAASALRVCLVWRGVSPIAVYVFTPTRIDALAIGACLAMAVRCAPRRVSLTQLAMIGVAGGATICAILCFIPDGWAEYSRPMQCIGYLGIAFGFAGVLTFAVSTNATSWLATILSGAVLTFLGRYSYALYFCHGPILFFLRDLFFRQTFENPLDARPLLTFLMFQLAVLGISSAIAWLSWHAFEQHFLALKRYFV